MYKLTSNNNITRLSDNASIPNDPANRDYAEYLEWLAEGNTPEPVDEPLPPTQEEAREALTQGVQAYLDTLARSIGYDSILSLCSYAASTNPTFSTQAQAGVNLRDGCWVVGHQITADVLAGNRAMPTLSEVLDELPSPVWPV